MRKDIKVLHDFDNAFPSGHDSFNRGLKLIIYSFSKKLHFLKRFCSDIYLENYKNIEVLAKLDSMLGLDSHFGINTRVQLFYPKLKSEIETLGAIYHSHWHEGKINAKWSPELPWVVPRTDEAYHYDQFYALKKIPKASVDDVLIFHVDRPVLLGEYIKALYDILGAKNV